MIKRKGSPYYTNRHSCFLLTYHMVLVTKYRRKALTGNIRESVYGTIRTILEEKGCNLLDLGGEEDHVHILFEAGPEIAPLTLANVIKTKTARFARRDYPDEVARIYYKPVFWTDSYFVTTVGSNTVNVVSEYIKNQ